MKHNISLRAAGIVAGTAAVCAFLFGVIITVSLPSIANKGEASPESMQTIPLVSDQNESPFTIIAQRVTPAVVNISAEKTVSQEWPGFEWRFDGPFEEFFRDFFRDMPRGQSKTQTLGSGFIISEDGYIVTNYHVIKGANAGDIYIKLTDKREFKGDEVTIVGTDQRTDIALLKIKPKEKLPYLTFGNSDNVAVGDWAIAFGNPFHLEGTVTVGVISAKGRSNIPLPEGPDFQSFIQTDAAINPGNSGGPLVSIKGEVIGINTAITSPTGGNVGIGFAIPASMASAVITELRTEGKVTRGYLGVYLQEITEDLKEALDLPSLDGVLISDVVENTPAERAGIKSRDVIVEFNGKPVKDMQAFRVQVAATPVNKSVNVKLVRDGKEKTVQVTIGQYPDEPSIAAAEEPSLHLGLKVIDADAPNAQRYDIQTSRGVVVTSITPDSPAQDAGVRVGDVIIAIGKKTITDTETFERTAAGLKKGEPVIFHIQRGDRKLYVAVTP
jgi:serine protease Do